MLKRLGENNSDVYEPTMGENLSTKHLKTSAKKGALLLVHCIVYAQGE